MDDNGTVVRHALGMGVFGQALHQFAWDGRNDAGRIVPDGLYHVKLELKDEDRTIDFPNTVRVDSTPPTIQLTIRPRVFSPDGDKRADRVDVRYKFDEQAYAILYVDGKRVGRSGRKKATSTYAWYGRGKRPGDYRLALAARDLAGNVAGSTRAFTVRLRYIDLFATKFTPLWPDPARPVLTDAKTVGWRSAQRAGQREAAADQASGAVEAGPVHATVTQTATAHGQPSLSASSVANLPRIFPLAASLERAVTDSAELLLAAGAVLALAYGLTRARIGVFQWPLLGASVLALGVGAGLGGWAWHEKQPKTVVGSPTEEFSNTLRQEPKKTKPSEKPSVESRRCSGRPTATTSSGHTWRPTGAT